MSDLTPAERLFLDTGVQDIDVRSYVRKGKVVRGHTRKHRFVRTIDATTLARLRASRREWSERVFGDPDFISGKLEQELRVARNVKLPRSLGPDAEKMAYAEMQLQRFGLDVPEITSWPEMRSHLTALYSDAKKSVAHELPEPIRPGGEHRKAFRAAINPKRVEALGPLAALAYDRMAEAMEVATSGETVTVPFRGGGFHEGPGIETDGKKTVIDLSVRADFWAAFYPDARNQVAEFAERYDMDPGMVADIMAILSPGANWAAPGSRFEDDPTYNQGAARRLIEAMQSGQEYRPAKKPGEKKSKITDQMIAKAVATYNTGQEFRDIEGVGFGAFNERKTTNFAMALFGVPTAFVADRHMANLGFTTGYAEAVVSNVTEYDALEVAGRRIAAQTDMDVATVQAVLWGYQREIGGVVERKATLKEQQALRDAMKQAAPDVLGKGAGAQELSKAVKQAGARRTGKASNTTIAKARAELENTLGADHPFFKLPPIPDGDRVSDWSWDSDKQTWVPLSRNKTAASGPRPAFTRRTLQYIGLAEDATLVDQLLDSYMNGDIADMSQSLIDMFAAIGIGETIRKRNDNLTLAERLWIRRQDA